MNSKINDKRKSKKVINIAFIVIVLSIIGAIIFDLVMFSDMITTFLAAIIVPCIFFVVAFIGFIISFILIFGFYLVKEYGFWPINVAISFFKEIIGDINIAPNDIKAYVVFRVVLIVICSIIIILGISSKIIAHREIKKGITTKYNEVRPLSTTVIVLGVIGVLVSVGAIIIFTSL